MGQRDELLPVDSEEKRSPLIRETEVLKKPRLFP